MNESWLRETLDIFIGVIGFYLAFPLIAFIVLYYCVKRTLERLGEDND